MPIFNMFTPEMYRDKIITADGWVKFDCPFCGENLYVQEESAIVQCTCGKRFYGIYKLYYSLTPEMELKTP